MPVFKRSDKVVWDELAGEAVLVQPDRAATFVLNPSGAFVWKRCDGRTPVDRIVADLSAGGAEAARVEAETAAFCAALQAKGLLEEAPAAPARTAPPARFAAPYVAPRVNLEELADKPNQRPGKRDIGGSRP